MSTTAMSIITTPDMCVIATIDICVARIGIIVRTALRGLRFYLYPEVGAASGGKGTPPVERFLALKPLRK